MQEKSLQSHLRGCVATPPEANRVVVGGGEEGGGEEGGVESAEINAAGSAEKGGGSVLVVL